MYASCLEKQEKVKELFEGCATPEAMYKQIMALGAKLSSLPSEEQTDERLVRGCQSRLFLKASFVEGLLYFEAASDALISRGLAYLLVFVYSGQSPEAVLKCPPTFLEELGIVKALSPNRAGGLSALHLKMQQEALQLLVQASSQ